MYSTDWCGYCRKARKLLNEMGVTFVEKDIEEDPTARREYLQKTGGRTGVPTFDFAGVIMQGYSEEVIRAQVARLGYPVEKD